MTKWKAWIDRHKLMTGAGAAFLAASVAGFGVYLATEGDGGEQPAAMRSPAPSSSPRATNTVTPIASPAAGASIPQRPGELEQYGPAIAAYLTANRGSTDCLAELRDAWGMPESLGPGEQCLQRDTNGDRVDDLVVVVSIEAQPLNPSGDVLIFNAHQERYELVFSASSELGRTLTNSSVIDAEDVDGDGTWEVLYGSTSVGANTGTTEVFGISWDGARFRRVTPDGLGILNPLHIGFDLLPGFSQEPKRLGVSEGLPASKLVMRGDTVSSAGFGLQRSKTYIYAWDGDNFRLAAKFSDPSHLLHFNILDANEAFAEGKLWLAVGRFQLAVADETLEDLKPLLPDRAPATAGKGELLPFAHFRLGLAFFSLGEAERGQAAIEAAATQFPESYHGAAAARFLDTVRASGDRQQACAAMTEFVRANAAVFEAIWNYGDTSPFKPEALCAEPGLVPLYPSLNTGPP